MQNTISPQQMCAYQVSEYGPGARFQSAQVTKPLVRAGHLLVKVCATSLNPVDHKILTTDLGVNPDLPAILHMDFAGIVEEVGEGVGGFKPGDSVYGCAGGVKGVAGSLDGALADFMLVDARLVGHMPKSLGFREAAALPLVGITAWEGLFDRAKLKPADHILVHAATGGVGHLAIQLAKEHGARVATTVSGEMKANLAKKLGADDVINYRNESPDEYVARLTSRRGFEVVFDTVGGANLDNSFAAAGNNGRVISIIGMNTHDLTPMHIKGLSLHLVFMLLPMLTGEGRARHGEILESLAALVDSGAVRPLIHEQRFTFEQVNEAHALFASGQYLGKITLENTQ